MEIKMKHKELTDFKEIIDSISQARFALMEIEYHKISKEDWKKDIKEVVHKVDNLLGDLQLKMISFYNEKKKGRN